MINLSEPQSTFCKDSQIFDLQTFTSKGNRYSMTHLKDGKIESRKCKVMCPKSLGLEIKQISDTLEGYQTSIYRARSSLFSGRSPEA